MFLQTSLLPGDAIHPVRGEIGSQRDAVLLLQARSQRGEARGRFDAFDALLCRDIETRGELLHVFGDG